MKKKKYKFPNSKISEAFLEFSMPLIEPLGDNPSRFQIEKILQITYTVWNSIILDTVRNNNNCINMLRESLSNDSNGLALIEELISRKLEKYGDDFRLIGNYSLREESEEWRLRVEAKDPFKIK